MARFYLPLMAAFVSETTHFPQRSLTGFISRPILLNGGVTVMPVKVSFLV